jgi:hypothetical protein
MALGVAMCLIDDNATKRNGSISGNAIKKIECATTGKPAVPVLKINRGGFTGEQRETVCRGLEPHC